MCSGHHQFESISPMYPKKIRIRTAIGNQKKESSLKPTTNRWKKYLAVSLLDRRKKSKKNAVHRWDEMHRYFPQKFRCSSLATDYHNEFLLVNYVCGLWRWNLRNFLVQTKKCVVSFWFLFFFGISGVKKSTIGCLIREKHWFHHLSEQRVHGFVHLHHYHLQDLVSTFHRGYMTQTPHVVNSFSVFIRSGHQVWWSGHGIFGFLRVDNFFYLTLPVLIAVKLTSTGYTTPRKFKKCKLLHEKISTFFKTIIFAIRAKKILGGIIRTLESCVFWQKPFHHVEMLKKRMNHHLFSCSCLQSWPRGIGRHGPGSYKGIPASHTKKKKHLQKRLGKGYVSSQESSDFLSMGNCKSRRICEYWSKKNVSIWINSNNQMILSVLGSLWPSE